MDKEKKSLNNVEEVKSQYVIEDSDEEAREEARAVEEIYLGDYELHEKFYKMLCATDITYIVDELITDLGNFIASDNVPQGPWLKMFKLLFQIRNNAEESSLALQEVQNCLGKNSRILRSLRAQIAKDNIES